MRGLLAWLAVVTTRRPGLAIGGLAAVTIGLAATAATGLQVQVDLSQLGRADDPAVQAMERVRQDFGDPTATVQVILDAGPDGNLLTARGLAAFQAATQATAAALGPDLSTDTGRPQVLSLGVPVSAALAQQGLDPASDRQVGAMASRVLADNPQLAGLVSDDFDLDAGTARAAAIVALLDPSLDETARTDAAERVRASFEDGTHGALADVEVTVFSSGLFVSGLLAAIRAEAPQLFGLALLVVLAILALAYRSAFDVVIGFLGMVATVVWTFGIAALLGPGHLGWTGPLTQLAVIVPVLLVGLGIDYSVHLTARYREQRAAGQAPSRAADRALHTVGVSLVLATAATAIGFASIATAPLSLLADFGVFVAVGVVCAFIIMALLVPASRVLHDRRVGDTSAATVRELGLAWLMRGPIWLARRAPVVGLTVAAMVVGASLLASTGLEVEFDRDDFIPEGSDIEALLDRQEELFGGGVTEATFVVIDGDLTDPRLAGALEQAQQRVGAVEGVRTVGGTPQVRRLPGPDQQSTAVQIRTTVGDTGAARLHREITDAFVPVTDAGGSVAVTSEPIIIARMSEDLADFQLRSIALTLALVLVLLTAYYAVVRRNWLLGGIAMIPAVVSASVVLGAMWVLGISFNVLTATLTAIAIGIGVPYGVHVVNRYVEDLEATPDAVARTLHATGAALTGSALTTLGAFVVLSFSGLPPIRSLGLLGGIGIAVALVAAVLVQPGALVLWSRAVDRPNSSPIRSTRPPV
jgi:uncharacterized protein